MAFGIKIQGDVCGVSDEAKKHVKEYRKARYLLHKKARRRHVVDNSLKVLAEDMVTDERSVRAGVPHETSPVATKKMLNFKF